jgi:hypothetical protein
MKVKKEIARIDRLIESYKSFHTQYPKAGFKKTIHMLEDERAKITSKIGRKDK